MRNIGALAIYFLAMQQISLAGVVEQRALAPHTIFDTENERNSISESEKARSRLQKSLRLSKERLTHVQMYGILSDHDQKKTGIMSWRSTGGFSHPGETDDYIALNLTSTGILRVSQQADEMFYDMASGILQVLMERTTDKEPDFIGKTKRELEAILSERARYSGLFVIDPKKLSPRDRMRSGMKLLPALLRTGRNYYEVKLGGPIPMDAVIAILVPNQLKDIAQQVFTGKHVIGIPDENRRSIKIFRTSFTGDDYNHKIQTFREVEVTMPAYSENLHQAVGRISSKRPLLLHGLRLIAPSDLPYLQPIGIVGKETYSVNAEALLQTNL